MQSHLDDVVRFTTFLTQKPKPADVIASLARDFLRALKLQSIQFYLLHHNNNLELHAEAGQPKRFSADRSLQQKLDALEEIISTENLCKDVSLKSCVCDPQNKLSVTPFNNGTSLQGFYLFEWAEDGEVSAMEMELLCLYSALASIYFAHSKQLPTGISSTKEIAPDSISARQIQILRGMVEGRTNHELATELGFSVSTIRHETMAIFRALGVSDRKEAAKAAQLMSLI